MQKKKITLVSLGLPKIWVGGLKFNPKPKSKLKKGIGNDDEQPAS
jgi:hypothetical protein